MIHSHFGSRPFTVQTCAELFRSRAVLVFVLCEVSTTQFGSVPVSLMACASSGTDVPISHASSSKLGCPNGSGSDLNGLGTRSGSTTDEKLDALLSKFGHLKRSSRKFRLLRIGCPAWIHISRQHLGIFRPDLLRWNGISVPSLRGCARSRYLLLQHQMYQVRPGPGLHSNKLTAPQPQGPMAQDHLTTTEVQDADSIRLQARPYIAVFQNILEIVQPDHTRRDSSVGGIIRTLSRIYRTFFNMPMAEVRDFHCYSNVFEKLGNRTIPSDHTAVRLVIQKPDNQGRQIKRIPAWMPRHLVFSLYSEATS